MGGCPASITQTLPASVAVGSGTFWTPTHLLSAEMDMTCGQSSLRPSVLGTLGIWDRDQSVDFAPILHGKEKKKEDRRYVSCCLKAPKWKESFLNLQLDRICKMRVELCFFLLFSYICTDFFFSLAKMKANLTSGMPENLEFCLLELSWCLGI